MTGNTNNNHKNSDVVDEPSTTKYMIHADFSIDGLVEKPDVVGALFGQTEGLLSDDLELRELQKSGRVGRIQVRLSVRSGRTKGSISIPSSLDKVETSILAAAIETVDRIGPCSAKISIKNIEDIRREKMKKIRERASELLQRWNSEATQESSELADEVMRAARTTGITNYGRLPAGPEVAESDTVIVVEGRADIAACLRAGVRNTVAVQGASVPKTIVDLTQKKTTIAFLDGDRGGDLILKELLMYSTIDFVARAPSNREVEDLKPDEIIEQLSKKIPIEKASFITDIHANEILQRAIKRKATKIAKQKAIPATQIIGKKPERSPATAKAESSSKPPSKSYPRDDSRSSYKKQPYDKRKSYGDRKSSSRRGGRYGDRRSQRQPRRPTIPEELMEIVKKVDGTEKQEGIFLNDKLKEVKTVSVEKIYEEIKKTKGITKVIYDGVITQRILDLCDEKNIDTIVGARLSEITKRPSKTRYYTFA